MIQPNAPRFTYPQETWNAAKCAKAAKHRGADGLGTPHAFTGYQPYLPRTQDYNGGTIVNGEWYQGVIHHLPKLAKGYKWVSVCSWGLRIVGPNSEPYGKETPARRN